MKRSEVTPLLMGIPSLGDTSQEGPLPWWPLQQGTPPADDLSNREPLRPRTPPAVYVSCNETLPQRNGPREKITRDERTGEEIPEEANSGSWKGESASRKARASIGQRRNEKLKSVRV